MRPSVLCLLLSLICAGVGCAYAQTSSQMNPEPVTEQSPVCGWSTMTARVGIRKYINSFTSYEFPNPVRPALDPTSRLEWPWEQIYGTVRIGWAAPGFGVHFEYAATLDARSNLKAQDSDWQDQDNPGQKTTFSEAKANPRGWTFDASVHFALPFIQGAPRIRGVGGYRAQQFRFSDSDSLSSTIWDSDADAYLPQAIFEFDPQTAIEFSQYYKHWYAGLILETSWGPTLMTLFGDALINLRLQADWGFVKANNEDYHILRDPAPRFTRERTTGASWHVGLAASLVLNRRVTLEAEADFMRIRTHGDHTLDDPESKLSWPGARVWSDQKWISASAAISF